jgi:tol-pal system protein YbgF
MSPTVMRRTADGRGNARLRPGWLMACIAVLAAGCASTPPEQDPVQLKLNDLEERMARVERISANQAEAAQRMDQVQASIRELRGRLDEIEHSNEALGKQQRDLYSDLDKRLAAAGGSGGAAAGAAPGAPGSAPAAADAGAGTSDSGASAPPAGEPAAASSTEQAVYNQAFDALKARSYSVAITGFKDFLGSYPSSPLAENAQYWLGEAYYVNHDYEAASGAFRTVLKKWPDSRKSPDALLKLGYTQAAQKQYGAARSTLTEVTRKYPGTDTAKLAADRLSRLSNAGGQ